MTRRLVTTHWILLLATAVLLSACGVNLSGEPEVRREMEIPSLPTVAPTPTAAPTVESAAGSDTEIDAETDAQFATFTLTGGDYDLGFEVYLRECASCHGAQDGIGPGLRTMHDKAATRVEGMAADEYVYQSVVEPGAFVVDGYNNMMPTTYGNTLTEDEIRGLIAFVLEFDPARMGMGGSTSADSSSADTSGGDTSAAAPDAAATSEGAVGPALEAIETLTVTGSLIAGTTNGEPLPAGLPVQLYAVDPHGNLAGIYEVESTEDNTFTVEDVARTAGMTYFIEVSYQGVPQGTRVASITGSEESVSAAVTLYERTTEADNVVINWSEILVNYAPIDSHGIEVWLDLEVANMGDKIVTTDEIAEGSGWYVSVNVELPVGAYGIQPMQAENSQRYLVEVVDGVPVVKDTWPLRPGQAHTISIAYYLPYSTGAIIEHGFNFQVLDGLVLLPNDTVTFTSEQFDTAGDWRGRVTDGGASVVALNPDEKIDPDKDYTLVKAHVLEAPIPAGERMVFELDGRPTRTIDVLRPGGAAQSDDDDNLLAIALFVLGVGVIALAGVLWWRQRQAGDTVPSSAKVERRAPAWTMPRANASKDDLLAALSDLEDMYEAGNIDDETYQERRALLSERLLPLLKEED